MAERIGISLSQLNRYILLAKLDEKFVDAIGGHRAAQVVHARDINYALKRPHHTQMMLDEAALIIKEQIKGKEDRKRVVSGKGWEVREYLGGRGIIKNTTKNKDKSKEK